MRPAKSSYKVFQLTNYPNEVVAASTHLVGCVNHPNWFHLRQDTL